MNRISCSGLLSLTALSLGFSVILSVRQSRMYRRMHVGLLSLTALSLCILNVSARHDLTVVGQAKFAESLPRLSINIIDCLKNDLKINFIPTSGYFDMSDLSTDLRRILMQHDMYPGYISLFTDVLWTKYDPKAKNLMQVPQSIIKISYSMLESTALPSQWVTLLNKHFDAVVVPDPCIVKAYKSSGVTIPIFMIPCMVNVDDFVHVPIKAKKNKPFVFGMSAAFNARKNYGLLIKAFYNVYGNNTDYLLKLHGRAGEELPAIQKLLNTLHASNIVLIKGDLSRQQYVKFLQSLDCYVLPSRGEGFSLTPREAMALGIPCIISDTSAHKTIAKSGLVNAIPFTIKQPSYYKCFNQSVGFEYDCTQKELENALQDMTKEYDTYLARSKEMRSWVMQYSPDQLRPLYLGLFKPTACIRADENRIENGILYTNDEKLFNKYQLYLGITADKRANN